MTLEALDRDPHPVLATLCEHEPVSWLPALDGWLVTGHDLALTAMRDASRFTVDDPRFSTAQVIGPSMVDAVLVWYEAIVASVTSITAGRGATAEGELAFAGLQERLEAVLDRGRESSLLAAAAADSSLSREQIVSNAAVLLFGGIETTEGMIANAMLHLLVAPQPLERVRHSPELLDAAIDESLRLEPAAAVIDRYATVDTELGGAAIAAGELVRISISAANRDPTVFADPNNFDLTRTNHRRHLAFAQGPHVCVGVHLARLETRVGLQALLEMLPGLRLDPAVTAHVRGLVFRKPARLQVLWN